MDFLDNFDPETSVRERRKLNRKSYFMNKKTKSIYNERGQIAATGKDLCDCLDESCPGCHFPCLKCNSTKCGHECRWDLRWSELAQKVLELLHTDGTQQSYLAPDSLDSNIST